MHFFDVNSAIQKDRRHQAVSLTSMARTATEEEETRPGKSTQAVSQDTALEILRDQALVSVNS
jgi:hypothetical protein